MGDLLEQIKKDREDGTPDLGGWAWFGGRNDLYLATSTGGRRLVMGFRRKGMNEAQPTFQLGGRMVGAIDHLTAYVVGDGVARGQKQADSDPSVYRMDVKFVDHPDARRIARVPDMEKRILDDSILISGLVSERDQSMMREKSLEDSNQRCRDLQIEVNSLREQLKTFRDRCL